DPAHGIDGYLPGLWQAGPGPSPGYRRDQAAAALDTSLRLRTGDGQALCRDAGQALKLSSAPPYAFPRPSTFQCGRHGLGGSFLFLLAAGSWDWGPAGRFQTRSSRLRSGRPRLAIDERSHGYLGSGKEAGPGHDNEEETPSASSPAPLTFRWGRDG